MGSSLPGCWAIIFLVLFWWFCFYLTLGDDIVMSLICTRTSSFPICLKDYNQIYDANEQKYQRPYVCKRNGNAAISFAVMFPKTHRRRCQRKWPENVLETCFGNTYLCVYPCARTHSPAHMHTAGERLESPVKGRLGDWWDCQVAEMRRMYLGCLSGPQEGAHTVKLALCAQLKSQKRALKSNSKEGLPRGTYLKFLYNFMREMLKCCPRVCTNERKEHTATFLS